MLKLKSCLWLSLCTFAVFCRAAPVLTVGIADSDGPPIALFSNGQLQGGISRELGQLLAKELGTEPNFVVVSRKRVEWSLEHNRVDIICNANPEWYSNAEALDWSHEVYPQIERVASLKSARNITQISGMVGKRIATIRGYNYPKLESLWVNGQATQDQEARLDLMLKALTTHLADVAIVSELEYAYWAKNHKKMAESIKIQPLIFTSRPTMCAVSPSSYFSVNAIDHAIDRLKTNGRIQALLRNYKMMP